MLDGIPLASLTPAALLGIAILFIIVGRLIPRSTYLDKVKECEKWQAAYETSEKARVASDAQTRELLELAKTTNRIVQAMFDVTERARQSGGNVDVAVHATSTK